MAYTYDEPPVIEVDQRVQDSIDFILGAIPGEAFVRQDGMAALVLVEGALNSLTLIGDEVATSHINLDEKDEERGWQTGLCEF